MKYNRCRWSSSSRHWWSNDSRYWWSSGSRHWWSNSSRQWCGGKCRWFYTVSIVTVLWEEKRQVSRHFQCRSIPWMFGSITVLWTNCSNLVQTSIITTVWFMSNSIWNYIPFFLLFINHHVSAYTAKT